MCLWGPNTSLWFLDQNYLSLCSPIGSMCFHGPRLWSGWRERESAWKTKRVRQTERPRRPFFMIVCAAQIRPLPGCILNEEGLCQTHTRKAVERHWPWPWLALLPHEWLFRRQRYEPATPLPTSVVSTRSHSSLSVRPRKLTQLCQTHTFLFPSQCKQLKINK